MLSPNVKLALRQEITAFCKLAEQYERRWSYSQRRPYTGLGAAPQTWHTDDCSSYVALVFWWAGHHVEGGWLHDPLDQGYSGWGNTNTAYAYLKAHRAPLDKYRVGDIAIYGTASNTVHMTVCRKAGTGASAVWSSHGSQSGPEGLKLHYRGGVLGPFRHPALL